MEEKEFVPFCTLEELPYGPWLVLSPHPDDEVLGMGGTLALGVRNLKSDIYIAEVTSGELGGDPKKREEEVCVALKTLAIKEENILFWRLRDRKIDGKQLEELIKYHLKTIKPKSLFVPSPFEFHPDHRKVCKIATKVLSNREDILLIFYEITRQSEINSLVCIDTVFNLKKKAISCFKSQPWQKLFKISSAINSARTYTINNCNKAEGFFIEKNRPYTILKRLNSYKDFIWRRRLTLW